MTVYVCPNAQRALAIQRTDVHRPPFPLWWRSSSSWPITVSQRAVTKRVFFRLLMGAQARKVGSQVHSFSVSGFSRHSDTADSSETESTTTDKKLVFGALKYGIHGEKMAIDRGQGATRCTTGRLDRVLALVVPVPEEIFLDCHSPGSTF